MTSGYTRRCDAPLREQRLGAGAYWHREQAIQILRIIDIERDPRQTQHGRLDAAGLGCREMGKEADLPEAQWHRTRGRAGDRIRSALVARRHDGKARSRRLIAAAVRVSSYQLLNIVGL